MRTKVLRVAAVSATFFASLEFCAPEVKPFLPRDGTASHLSQLWEAPHDLESRDTLDGPWGRLFRNWESVRADANGYADVGGVAAQIDKTGAKALLRSIGILGTCIKEAPEFGGRRRHADAQKP